MMRNLVWTFWLALILAIIGTFITSAFLVKQWTGFVSYSQMEGSSHYPLQTLSIEVQTALNNKSDLELLLLNSPMNEFGAVYLIDPLGADVLGRTLPEEIMTYLEDQSLKRQPIFTRTIKSDRDELFSLIFHIESPAPIWKLFKSFGLYWVLFAALVVSGLISWWLATKTASPIQHIALASSFQGEGDILPKIDRKVLLRRDEIGELARQLQTSGIKIQDLIKKQKDLLRDVSHEVRTPLARLQVATETLELDIRDERALNQIREEVLIIDQLVQDLLHLSQFDRPSHSHKIESIPLSSLIDQCVERSEMLANHKNVSITVQGKDWRDSNITGIKFLLDRALDNLINNAIRHSPEHGKLRVSCEMDNERCCLGIWDQGEGVQDDSLEEIFEPFFRLDSSRNRQTGGFGLGLSLVKRIVELHEGSVIALNRPNGFVVKIIIPLDKNTLETASEVLDNK